jgi:proteasome lid subunit RPN8/RPN11
MTRLQIPRMGASAITRHVGDFGARGVETGGFLITAPGQGQVLTVAFAGVSDVLRRRDHFRIGGEALASLFAWVGEADLTIAAQFHSHRGAAFLSEVDLEHGFSVEGFVTCVLPRYTEPDGDPSAWGWWRYEQGQWHTIGAPLVTFTNVSFVGFDAGGVRAL